MSAPWRAFTVTWASCRPNIVDTGVVTSVPSVAAPRSKWASDGDTAMAPSARMSAGPLATKYVPLRMSPPACTDRSPPPTVVTVLPSGFLYQVVGSDTESSLTLPPAFTSTLPPMLITPWWKLAKSIDELDPSAALPTCIHCHQYCAPDAPAASFVCEPSASTTFWMLAMSPAAFRWI